MKQIYNYSIKGLLLLLIAPIVLLSSCKKEKEEAPDKSPVATLTVKEVLSNAATFTIKPLNVEKCAWICLKEDTNAPTANDVLSKGNVVTDLTKESEQSIQNLEPETKYKVYVAGTRKGNNILNASTLSFTTTKDEPQGEGYIPLTHLKEALYSTDDLVVKGYYSLVLSSCPVDENNCPIDENGVALSLYLYAPEDADPVNATLPNGEYTLDKTKELYIDARYTNVTIRTGKTADDLAVGLLSAGKVNIERTGDEYTLTMDLSLIGDVNVKAQYKGAIQFAQSGTSSYQRFKEAQDVTLTIANGRYYGNYFYPHADDLLLQFFSGEFNENGVQTDGYYLSVPLYMEKLVDYNAENPKIKEGTYNISPVVSYLNSIPYTFTEGSMQEIMGSVTPIGTYLSKIEKETGKKYIGFATEGTIVVKQDGDKYDITFNFTSENGTPLKAKFNGTINMRNFCDNDKNPNNPKRPWSTLTENVTLNFRSGTECLAYFMGNYLHKDYNSWIIMLVKEENKEVVGDMITMELLTPLADGLELKDATYTVSHEFKGYNIFPGFKPHGTEDVAYAWYGDLSSKDDEGYATKMAPINEGTMKVSNSDGNITFDFDFVDDNKHTIKGTWTGKATIVDYTQESTSQASPASFAKRTNKFYNLIYRNK